MDNIERLFVVSQQVIVRFIPIFFSNENTDACDYIEGNNVGKRHVIQRVCHSSGNNIKYKIVNLSKPEARLLTHFLNSLSKISYKRRLVSDPLYDLYYFHE